MNIRFRWLCVVVASLLLTATYAQAQPVPTADSGTFRTHPLVAAEDDSIRLQVDGTFGSSNARMTLDSFSISTELVTIDLIASWDSGDSAADAVSTAWTVDVEIGQLPPTVHDILVRVDGQQFLFDFFHVEAQRPNPAPLPDLTPTVTPRRSVGINLAPAKDHSEMLIFTDIFRLSRTWIPHRPSDDTWDTGQALDLDSRGWVRSLAPDQEAGTLMMLELGDAYPGGHYTVFYDGQGQLDFEWDARVIDRQPGRIDLWVTPEEGIHVVIRETDPDDYIRNIRVPMPGYENAPIGTFHPTYIEFQQQFGVVRFMDWVDSNEPENNVPEVGTWASRITPDHSSQGTIRGVALEHMIDAANEIGADPWFNVPIVADDAYVDSMATMIRDRLDAQRRVYVELSNEVWNPSFPQNAVATQRGLAAGYAPDERTAPFEFMPSGWIAGLRYHSARSVEVFQIFERVFGGTERLVRVIGGWQIDDVNLAPQIAAEILDWQDAWQHADAYAVAPYFGFFIAANESVDYVPSASLDALVDSVTADMRFMLQVSASIHEAVEQRGLQLMAYEAGHHMVQATETPFPTPAMEARSNEVHADERMFSIYQEYLTGIGEMYGHINLFNDSLPLGNFGLIARWDDATPSPKYRAVQAFLQTPAVIASADSDGDGDVDFDDFFAFADAFGGADPQFDFDGDGVISFDDFFVFADAFGTSVGN